MLQKSFALIILTFLVATILLPVVISTDIENNSDKFDSEMLKRYTAFFGSMVATFGYLMYPQKDILELQEIYQNNFSYLLGFIVLNMFILSQSYFDIVMCKVNVRRFDGIPKKYPAIKRNYIAYVVASYLNLGIAIDLFNKTGLSLTTSIFIILIIIYITTLEIILRYGKNNIIDMREEKIRKFIL